MSRLETRTAILLLGLAIVTPLAAGIEPPARYREAWERLKTLSGTWESHYVGEEDRTNTISYHVTGGEAVVFEEFLGKTPDGVRSMATAYHLDVDGLVATHYCGAGNQPRMRATSYDPQARLLRFDFWDVTNLPDPEAYYTTNIELSFESDDEVELRFRGTTAGVEGEWSVHRLRRLSRRPHERPADDP